MRAHSSSVRALATPLSYPLVRRPSPRSKLRATARWLALIAITQQISCAGGGGTSSNSNVDPSPAVTVSISPASAQITAGATVQLLVIVQNASNPAVNWQVNGIPGGNSSVGTITPAGADTASYTAPTNVSSILTVTVAAVLQADPTKAGSAQIIINPPPGAVISISPANPTLVPGASQQFNATIQNGPQAVIWEVDGMQTGNSTIGFINSSGFYTAPAIIPTPPTVTITAILETDLSVSGGTIVTIVAPTVSLSISPSTANVPSGQTQQFSASVQNSNAGVTWEVNGTPGGDPLLGFGTISSSGLYTAPASVPVPPTVTVTAVLQTDSSISASAGITVILSNTFTGVYSWKYDNSLTGQNPQETKLTPSTVSLTTFGKLFSCAVDGQVYAQPLYVANVTIASVPHNVVYVATEHDSVYAFDADANPCEPLWQVSFINPAGGVTTVPATDISGQTDIAPEIGITGTPVIDPATATLYVVAKTKENGAYFQRLHALDLATGAEKFGGPAVIQAVVSGIGSGSVTGNISFNSRTENQRSALLLAGGNIYVAFDSYGDADSFHGWLLAYDAADLTKSALAVFNSTPNGNNGGIGESGAAPSSDANGNLFVATSDGTFDANSGGSDYAETLLELLLNTPNSGFAVADTFTPWNQAILGRTQNFFGSTGVLLLPDSAGIATHPHLALAGSEAGSLYLLDRDNLGGFSSGGPDKVVQTLSFSGALLETPGYWAANNTAYFAAAGDNLRALPLSAGMLSAPSCSPPNSCSADTFPLYGASPVISSNGSTGGIVWALDTSGSATSSAAILRAYDATNLANELYASPASGGGAAGLALKFTVPTVANGKVYIGTQNELSVFGLK